MVNSNVEEQYRNLEEEAERQPRTANAAEPLAADAADDAAAAAFTDDAVTQTVKSSAAPVSSAAVKKEGRRGKRKADVVRPGPLYQIIDAIITIAGLALVGAVILYVIMIFG